MLVISWLTMWLRGSTGEILAEAGTIVTRELADAIQNAAVPFVWIQGEEDRRIKSSF
mgnify:CR=1 FL=1